MEIIVNDILNYLDKENINYTYRGKKDIVIDTFCSLKNPKNNSITWIKKYSDESLRSFEDIDSCLIVTKEISEEKDGYGYILTDEPKNIFFSILSNYWKKDVKEEISSSSIVLTKNIGKNVYIGNNCVIDKDCIIGDNTIIGDNVVLKNKVIVGNNCIIKPGAVIGTDGFGYWLDEDNVPHKVDHYGGVVIEDNVHIGANTCIDRGTIDDTLICKDAKIDNLCHIGHNVIVGPKSMVVAESVLCGSSELGEGCYLAPGVIVRNQIKLGNNTFVNMNQVANKNTYEDTAVMGQSSVYVKEGRKNIKL